MNEVRHGFHDGMEMTVRVEARVDLGRIEAFWVEVQSLQLPPYGVELHFEDIGNPGPFESKETAFASAFETVRGVIDILRRVEVRESGDTTRVSST